jgi:uncharacterized lipoprotein YajG
MTYITLLFSLVLLAGCHNPQTVGDKESEVPTYKDYCTKNKDTPICKKKHLAKKP